MKSKQIIGSLAIVTALGLLSGCSQDDAAGATAGGAAGNDSSSGNNGQIGNSQQTGKIAADGFYLLFDPAVPEVIDNDMTFTRQQVTVTVFADDINDLEDIDGWTVSFKTEWGTFLDDKDSCVLKNGNCSVKWQSGSPATIPGSCYASITAWAVGEENFADLNDNGKLDAGEPFYDIEEPYLDIDGSGSYTPNIFTVEGTPELIDVQGFNGQAGKNGIHDSGNGLYDGSFCASGNTASCSGRNSVVIHYRASINLKKEITGPNDCGSNPY
jgi:hypothetical protein